MILILGVLLLGPQRIPEAAASLGKAIRSFRRATRELRDQIDIEDEVRRPLEDLRAALRDEPPLIAPPPPVRSVTPPIVAPPSEQIHSSTDAEPHAAAAAAASEPAPPPPPALTRVPVYRDPSATPPHAPMPASTAVSAEPLALPAAAVSATAAAAGEKESTEAPK